MRKTHFFIFGSYDVWPHLWISIEYYTIVKNSIYDIWGLRRAHEVSG